MLRTSRVLAQRSSALSWPSRSAPHARMSGTGSTPVSAIRPAKTETTEGTAGFRASATPATRSEEHTSELQSLRHLVCRLLLEKKKKRDNSQLPALAEDSLGSKSSRSRT